MQKLKSTLTRFTFGLTAAALGLIAAMPLVLGGGTASAYNQVTSRSIQMNTAHISATDNMKVTFTNITAANGSLVVNFCKESPIQGATCTTPSGFSAASATLTTGSLPAGWTVGTNAAGTFEAKGGTTLAATTSYNFTMTGVTNPNGTDCATVNCSFYARLYLYNGTTYGTYSSSTSPGNFLDFGGFALSTVNDIVINATVQETLTFCTSKVAPGNGCSGLTTPTLTLGHGSPTVLDSTATDTDTANTQLTTNAATGAVVNLFQLGGYTCAGLSSNGGTTCGIPGLTSLGGITIGTAAFGLQVQTVGHGGCLTPDGNYSDATTTNYDYRAAVNSSPGDPIENSNSVPVTNCNGRLTYAATASVSTPPGVYTTTDSLIATGTF